MKRWDQARAAMERRVHRRTVFEPVVGLTRIGRYGPKPSAPHVPPAIDHNGKRHPANEAHEIAIHAARSYPGWSGPSVYGMLTHTSGACVQRRHKSDPITWNWFPVPVDRHRSVCLQPKNTIEEAMAAALGWDIVQNDYDLWDYRHQTLGHKDGYLHAGSAADAARYALQIPTTLR